MLQTLLGIVAGVVLVIAVELLKKPRLTLRMLPPLSGKYPQQRPARRSRVAQLQACNEPLPWWARWMARNAAQQCRATVTFYHLDGQNVFGRSMPVKWVRTPEGLPMQIVNLQGEPIFALVDPVRIGNDSRVDIAPGESADFDVAVRFDDDVECYGWNLDSYRSDPPWRNPQWKLERGRYLIRVEIFSGDQSCSGLFRLINDVPGDAFRLEPALANDNVVGR